MKTYILSKLAGVHLSQYLGHYCISHNINVKVFSVHLGFINNMDWEKLLNGGYYRDCLNEKIKPIGLLENA